MTATKSFFLRKRLKTNRGFVKEDVRYRNKLTSIHQWQTKAELPAQIDFLLAQTSELRRSETCWREIGSHYLYFSITSMPQGEQLFIETELHKGRKWLGSSILSLEDVCLVLKAKFTFDTVVHWSSNLSGSVQLNVFWWLIRCKTS